MSPSTPVPPESPTPAAPSRRSLLRALGAGGLLAGLGPLVASSASATPADAVRQAAAVRHGRATLVTLLQTADLHGQIETHDEFFWEGGRAVYRRAGGMARIQTLVNRARAENPEGTLLVDGGDCIQGSGWTTLSRGELMAPVMAQLHYDAVSPGNWEVVYGKDQLVKVMGGFGAPVVSSNMFHDADDPESYLFAPVHVQNVAGVRVGFLAFNDPTVPVRQDPSYSLGIRFTHPDANAARWVRHLREVERCDLVFAMTHMGIAQQVDLASRDFMEGVDFVLGSDTHERIRTPIEGAHAKVTEPGAFGSFVGRLDLVVERGAIRDAAYELVEVGEETYAEDRKMRTVLDGVKAPYRRELEQVIGHTSTPLLRYYILETPMDNLITDALYETTNAELAASGRRVDVALSNGFRFCPPLVPGSSGTAAITRDYLWSMLPVNSRARIATVKGSLVKGWMERELNNVFAADPLQRFGGWVVRMKGMTVGFTAGNPVGQRVNRIEIGGEPLDVDRDYVFVACERADPPDVLCRIKGVTGREDLSFTLHDAVERHLAAHSPVAPRLEGRVTATDLPDMVLGQLPGTDYQFR
jgi:2',3'-cyclic-nucleotide 2'-phosphodiesterase (5'-nucleotidase family)